jgi:hypothetical protein
MAGDEESRRYLLLKALDDWISVEDVVWAVRLWAHASTPQEIKTASIRLIRDLSEQQLVRLGTLSAPGGGFVPSPRDTEEAIKDLELEWGLTPTFIDLGWLALTEQGRTAALQAEEENRRRAERLVGMLLDACPWLEQHWRGHLEDSTLHNEPERVLYSLCDDINLTVRHVQSGVIRLTEHELTDLFGILEGLYRSSDEDTRRAVHFLVLIQLDRQAVQRFLGPSLARAIRDSFGPTGTE